MYIKRNIAIGGSLLCAVIMLLIPEGTAYAQEALLNDVTTELTKIVGLIIHALHLIAWVAFVFLSYLLDPEFIFYGMLPRLNLIWQTVRNFVNIILAFVLIGAALYTIISANTSIIKEYILKFILAVILVNFSWFVPRVILDIANVSTSAAFGLASHFRISEESSSFFCQDPRRPGERCKIITDARFFAENTCTQTGNTCQTNADCGGVCVNANSGYICHGGVICYKEAVLTPQIATSSAILNGLIINYSRLPGLATVPRAGPVQNKTTHLLLTLLRLAIVLILHIALVVPMIAMVAAFFLRIPILWVTIAFMPLAILTLVGGEKLGDKNPKRIWDLFITAAFLPTLVAAVLSIGFLMLIATSKLPSPIDINFPITNDLQNLWDILWMFVSFAILWIAVFAALRTNQIIGGVTDKIKSYGENLGRAALKIPGVIPFIPGPRGSGGMSPQKIFNLARNPSGTVDAIGNQLSDGKTIRAAIAALASGRVAPTARARTIREAAATITPASAQTIAEKIRDAINAGDINDVDNLITHLENDVNDKFGALDLKRGNLVKTLEALRDKETNKDLKQKLDDNNIDLTKLQDIIEAAANPPQNPPPPPQPPPSNP